MSLPVDQAVLEALRSSPVGPVMDKPLGDVLRDMGLPPLPEIPPLPEFPMPVIDLAAIARPLTDLAGSFGTGQFPSAPEVDPVQVLSQVSSVVQTAIQIGSSAMQLAASQWAGAGAEAAAVKQAQVTTDSAAVAGQSAETSKRVAIAAGSVSRGSFALSAIIAKYLTSLAAAAPFIPTPPGQVFVAALSAETLTEAVAVVAQTRAELTVHSAEMTATGTKIPVTDAPDAGNAMQILSQLMQIVPMVTNAATTGAKAIAQTMPPKPVHDRSDTDLARHESSLAAGGVPLGGGPLAAISAAVGGGGPAPAPRPLAPWTGAPAAGQTSSTPTPASTSPSNSSPAGQNTRSTPGFIPAGAAGGMARGAGESSSTGDTIGGQLVTGQHGNEVVGDLQTATPPVIGATDHTSGRPPEGPPPDKALTL